NLHTGKEQNTWLFGLKRMLLGYAVGSDPTGRSENDWHDIEPYGEVAGLDATLLGPLAQLLTLIESLLQVFSERATPIAWADRLRNLLLDFFEATDADESYLLLQLQTTLEQWLTACEEAGLSETLPLSVVRDFWLSQIDQGGLSQRFFAGSLTFATLMPMRAIPFRRIYLLGMNDGEYPRIFTAMDFDLMARNYRPGDRSRREDDRYLFLEALLSVREHLHISWVGRSIHDNSERPPSVLVSQLRDHLAACWRLIENCNEKSLLDALTVEHRLQAFSKDYFDKTSQLFTYAPEWRPAVETTSVKAIHNVLSPQIFEAPVSLGQLIAFMKDPVKTFMRERLGVFYEIDDLTAEDQEPFAIDKLGQWGMQDELIRVRLDAKQRGEAEDLAVQRQLDRLQRQGLLPIGAAGDMTRLKLNEPLDQMFELYDAACQAWPNACEDEDIFFTHTAAGQTVEIQGRLSQLFSNGQQYCRIEIMSSNLFRERAYRYDKLIPAWVQHLAGHLNGRSITTLLIGKNGQVTLKPLQPEQAKQHFIAIIEAYVAGLRSPLPYAVQTGFAWLARGQAFEGPIEECPFDEAIAAAQKCYEGTDYSRGELQNNAYLQRVFPSFESLWSEGAFSIWAARLLMPLRDHFVEKTDKAQVNGDQA
ncbi:MAG: exodeoxyribonuclease V subunit gamma, partial [Methylomonas sp.]